MKGRLRDLTVNRDGTQNITVTVDGDFSRTFDALKGHEVAIDIKKASAGRSKDANAFCWALCSDIGKAMTPPQEKEDVYRTAIRAAGVFWQVPIPAFHIDNVRKRWEDRGTGWFLDVVDDDEPGRKLCHLYCGTSSYSVDEMKTVIDWLTDQCRQMSIPIPLSKKEETEMLERWGKK